MRAMVRSVPIYLAYPNIDEEAKEEAKEEDEFDGTDSLSRLSR